MLPGPGGPRPATVEFQTAAVPLQGSRGSTRICAQVGVVDGGDEQGATNSRIIPNFTDFQAGFPGELVSRRSQSLERIIGANRATRCSDEYPYSRPAKARPPDRAGTFREQWSGDRTAVERFPSRPAAAPTQWTRWDRFNGLLLPTPDIALVRGSRFLRSRNIVCRAAGQRVNLNLLDVVGAQLDRQEDVSCVPSPTPALDDAVAASDSERTRIEHPGRGSAQAAIVAGQLRTEQRDVGLDGFVASRSLVMTRSARPGPAWWLGGGRGTLWRRRPRQPSRFIRSPL